MASSLSNRVENVAKGIHKTICKDCHCFFECKNVNENLTNYKCLSCNKNHSKKISTIFQTNFPPMDKPDSWFLPAKCLKNTCGRVTF